MPNGTTDIVYNPSERAISDDQNRAQRFRGADLNELLRAIVDTNCGNDDIEASARDAQTTTQLSPASATVFNGLVVRPQLGTLNLLVDPGVIGLYDPDATPNPDESQFKVIRDPGIQTVGALVMAGNTSGSTRIDVIECARVAGGIVVLETDNRDIFNPITGLFTASTVNKVVQGRLQYYVRQGVPGSGFPGTRAGWVPLAVVSIPTGVSTVNGMTFWDVRPFAGDRVFAPYNLQTLVPRPRRNMLAIDTFTALPKAQLTGYVEASATDPFTPAGGLYRLGGLFAVGTSSVDFNVVANQSGALTAGPIYLYLLEPFGLPRWAQYRLNNSGALVPAQRGIPVVSSVAPLAQVLSPSTPLSLPTPSGLGGTTSKAVCVGCTLYAGGFVQSMLTDGEVQTGNADLGVGIFDENAGTFAGSNAKHVLVAGTDYPAHATYLLVTLSIVMQLGASSQMTLSPIQLQVEDAAFAHQFSTIMMGDEFLNSPAGSAINVFYSRTVRVPVPANAGSFGLVLQLDSTVTSGSITFEQTRATVVGWGV